jgi:hypothetical protein
MPSTQPLLFKLDQYPAGRGLRCDQDGLFLAGESLLERDEENRFRPRASDRLRKIFSETYRDTGDWDSRIRSVKVVSDALNNGDMARAMMAAVLMRLPEPNGPIRIADVDGVLAKAGYDPSEPRDERGRWTSGGNESSSSASLQQAFFQPFIEPLIEPLIEETPIEPVPMPPPTDIVPPTLGPRRFDRAPPLANPYPDRPECVEEWARAERFCDDLRRRGKLRRDRGNRGFGATFDQCLRGRVSESCGGNPVEYAEL